MSTSTEFYRAMDIPSIQKSFSYHLKYSLSLNPDEATQKDYFHALCLTIRDRLVERWIETQELYREQKVKQTYYLSMEYLMGRSLGNNILNLEIWDLCKQALAGLNISLEKILDVEVDAGLGNGGLGRLAACFLDSLTTLGLPAIGYGLRYEYGIFRQEIVKGEQKEEPDPWLRHGHYFEVQRPQESYPVHFGGHVQLISHGNRYHFEWIPATTVIAVPFDVPIIGYKQDNVNTLRLWSALSSHEFDLEDFNEGDYIAAVKSKIQAENLTKVLYPNDNNHSGKELRFRQQYFFVAASIYDIFIHFRRISSDIYELPQKVAIQLNDTHPSLAVAEFMRILLDEWNLTWEKSWEITTQVFGYTNHTLLPEALEEWPVSFFKELLPRHLQIIEEINRRFLEEVAISAPGDRTKLEEMSLINTQREEPHVRMAYLATVASHKINGVSKLHTELLKNKVLKDFATLYPQRFLAITNGITQRRWLLKANPGLAQWICRRIGKGWIKNLSHLKELESYLQDSASLEELQDIKRENKKRIAKYIQEKLDITLSPHAIFDVQIKRIHEYKRQLMNILEIILLYKELKENPNLEIPPVVFLFGGKAAPGYYMAKKIIKFIHNVANLINKDPKTKDRIQIVFVPNYGVTLAELLIPGTDISQQISTAGHEASGTGNMKFALNGALTLGTLDGANVEILEQVGEENIFIFGLKAEEIYQMRESGTYRPKELLKDHPQLQEIMDWIMADHFSLHEPGIFEPLVHSLLEQGDYFFVLADLLEYHQTRKKMFRLYQENSQEWMQKSLINIARMGYFSSDRTIMEYSTKVWNIQSCPVDMTKKKSLTLRFHKLDLGNHDT